MEVATGKVIGSRHRRHRAEEFKKFLTTLDREVPDDLAVHLILDRFENCGAERTYLTGTTAALGHLGITLDEAAALRPGRGVTGEHAANDRAARPAAARLGRLDNDVWGLWEDFRVVNYVNPPGSEFSGGQAFNQSGRSVFWDGLISRMGLWEHADWPVEDLMAVPGLHFPTSIRAGWVVRNSPSSFLRTSVVPHGPGETGADAVHRGLVGVGEVYVEAVGEHEQPPQAFG